MQEKLQLLAEIWIGHKARLIEYIGLSNDAMHVHGSLLILFGSAILVRRRPDSVWCWLIVLIAELFNEFADMKGLAPGEASIDASLHDLYNTMFWPTVIVVMGRFLFPPRARIATELENQSSDFADQAFEKPPTV